ncbi:MAG: hypothetical protein ABJE47_16030 [bacterium]
MDPDVMSFAQVSVIIVCLVGSLTLIAAVAWRVLTGGNRRKAKLSADDDQRLEHLQQSVDAIAIEVERIAEAQRFTAKLMSERESVPKLS